MDDWGTAILWKWCCYVITCELVPLGWKWAGGNLLAVCHCFVNRVRRWLICEHQLTLTSLVKVLPTGATPMGNFGGDEKWKHQLSWSGLFVASRHDKKTKTFNLFFSSHTTSQKPKRPSVSDCKCYIMPGPVSWSNQGVFWGMYQEETSVVVRECCLLFSPDFNHLPKFVQEFTKCSLSYTHKHILGPSAHNPLWPSKSLNCSPHTHHTAREEFLALFLSAGGIPSGPEGKSRGIWPDGGNAQV